MEGTRGEEETRSRSHFGKEKITLAGGLTSGGERESRAWCQCWMERVMRFHPNNLIRWI